MDLIFIHDFRLDISVGINEWEQAMSQPIRLDLDIGLPGSGAGLSEDLADTIDYGAVVARIEALVAERRFALLEALAERIARLVLDEFGAPWVRVRVAKLGILKGVQRLGVVIERERGVRPR